MKPSRLTAHDLALMFELHYTYGLTRAEIARKFDISWWHCSGLLRGERLAGVTGPLLCKYRLTVCG